MGSSLLNYRVITVASFVAIWNFPSGLLSSTNNNSELPDMAVLRRLPHWRFTTKAYEQEALRLFLEEANGVARELKLPEHLPITKNDLIEIYIGPPALVVLGMISTSNYAYYASVGRTFSGLNLRNQGKQFDETKMEFTWPVVRKDTNQAFQVATQMMAAVKIDVSTLNMDCAVTIDATEPQEMRGKDFIPDYWVTWRRLGKVIAYIEFVEPTRAIRQLHVWDPKYILRKPIRFPNLAELLNQTNTPVMPAWISNQLISTSVTNQARVLVEPQNTK